MVGRYLFRSRAFWLCFLAGIGGTFPDWAYLPGVIYNIPRSVVLHEPIAVAVYIGVFIASGIGLITAMVLRRK